MDKYFYGEELKKFVLDNKSIPTSELMPIIASKFERCPSRQTINVIKKSGNISYKKVPVERNNKIIQYMKDHPSLTSKAIQEGLVKELGIEVNFNTLRSLRKRHSLNRVDPRYEIKHKGVKVLKEVYKGRMVEEIAKIISNRLGITVTKYQVARWKKELGLKSEIPPKGRKVLEFTCQHCGKTFYNHKYNYKAKYCSHICACEAQKKRSLEKFFSTVTNDDCKKFIKEWKPYAITIINVCVEESGINFYSDLYDDFITNVPSLIYHIKRHGWTQPKHIKGYIRKSVLNGYKKFKIYYNRFDMESDMTYNDFRHGLGKMDDQTYRDWKRIEH